MSYGKLNDLSLVPSTVVFVSILILLSSIKFFFKILEKIASNVECDQIFSKLKEELMMLGIVSFIISTIESVNPNLKDNDWFESFVLPTTVIDFVAFAFVGQAVFLARYAMNAGKVHFDSLFNC
jgi:hypothetical protein